MVGVMGEGDAGGEKESTMARRERFTFSEVSQTMPCIPSERAASTLTSLSSTKTALRGSAPV